MQINDKKEERLGKREEKLFSLFGLPLSFFSSFGVCCLCVLTVLVQPKRYLYLGARSKGIQQPASKDCAASSITTKSKCSALTSLRGPSADALVLVAKTTSALVRISVMALSSLCLSSSRRVFISCFRCFFSEGFRVFLTFI